MRRPVAIATIGIVALTACSGDSATDATQPTLDLSATTTIDLITTATVPTPGPPPARIDEVLDAAGYATRLSQAELVIRDPASTSDQVAAAGAQLQLLVRELADVPELDEAVLAGLDASVRPTIERIVRARQFVQARNAANPTTSGPSPTLPAWTVVTPQPADALRALYTEAEALTSVPWYWLAAIHLQETRMGRIVGVSSAGAVGPMQFLPATWAECCVGDPLITRDAIIGAATYLTQSGAPTDMAAAIHQYNPNDGYVAVVTAYAENLRDVPDLYDGYHAFQVFYSSAAGTVRLPVGYSQPTAVDAAAYLAEHPLDAA